MDVKIKKLHKEAVTPKYSTDGAACFDIHSLTEGVVMPNAGLVCDTGLAFEVPQGHAMFVFSRSGHGFKQAMRLANAVGVIDADFRGQIRVKLTVDCQIPVTISKFDRVAQALILPVEQVNFIVTDELSSTDRGQGGFGSTGA